MLPDSPPPMPARMSASARPTDIDAVCQGPRRRDPIPLWCLSGASLVPLWCVAGSSVPRPSSAADGSLELGLVHLRAALDVLLAGLVVELVPRPAARAAMRPQPTAS